MLYRRTFLSLGPIAIAGLAGCATRPRDASPGLAETPAPSAMTDEQALEASLQAMALVGTPYRYGGNTPQGGFDCSGLIVYVYRRVAGIAPPRTVRAISEWGQPIAASHLRSGDLVIFGGGGVATHAGIHIGQSRFVHAPSTGGTVRLNSVHERYWAARLIGYRRPLNA
ncbi:C40 family peptidase [Ramlibacter sp. AW1]|uniref:C40 family peptidase n=2 Tax=Ramlibacter aurantiacus TaxID=2801330 RepID=A0A937D7F6_9BURK|nr:C40 family peptidase [Ramlibacter aurantiacus]